MPGAFQGGPPPGHTALHGGPPTSGQPGPPPQQGFPPSRPPLQSTQVSTRILVGKRFVKMAHKTKQNTKFFFSGEGGLVKIQTRVFSLAIHMTQHTRQALPIVSPLELLATIAIVPAFQRSFLNAKYVTEQ